MKNQKYPQDQSQKAANGSQSSSAADLNLNESNFVPSADEVARKAYFTYVSEGSQPGNHVQHWLAAEAELIAERNRTRVHGFHNKT
ncbi:MAG TPA: DUF2934 domain-containing protein [Verrucomicrobiae bacterium]|jgi:hypothetical protein|nr:DUF2934 domain-containing protein [Verrucomicrobiae bacterium]